MTSGSLPVVVGLIIIWVVFQTLQPRVPVRPQPGQPHPADRAPVGIIAIGIVLVLLLGEIDLSVGSVSGLAAAIVVVGLIVLPLAARWSPVLAASWPARAIGLLYGVLYTRFGVPSFVITLAGLLGFLGLQLYVLGKRARSTSRSTRASSSSPSSSSWRRGVALRAGRADRRGCTSCAGCAIARRRARRGCRRRRSPMLVVRAGCSLVGAARPGLVPQPGPRRSATCSCCSSRSWWSWTWPSAGPRWGRHVYRRRRQRGGGPAGRHQRQPASTCRCSRCARPSPRSAASSPPAGSRRSNQSQRRRRHQPQRHRGGGDRRHEPVRRPRVGVLGAARHHRASSRSPAA